MEEPRLVAAAGEDTKETGTEEEDEGGEAIKEDPPYPSEEEEKGGEANDVGPSHEMEFSDFVDTE